MVQVLNSVPSFGSQLAQVLGQSIGNLGEGYYQGKRNDKDRTILSQIEKGGREQEGKFVPYTPMEKVSLIAGLSADKQKAIGPLYAPLLKEEAKGQRQQSLLQQYGFNPKAHQVSHSSSKQDIGSPAEGNNQNDISSIPDEQLVSLALIPELKGIVEAEQFRRKQKLNEDKFQYSKVEAGNKETADYRKNLAERSDAAGKAISNKERLLELVKTGNLDDPTYANIAQLIPYNFGKRLLSPETSEYKSALFDEYAAIKNTFSGATRVEEIKIFTDKLADTYLTDTQKERILKAGIKTLEADVIKADIAADIEKEMPGIGILQFTKEVERRSKGRLQKIVNEIAKEYESVLEDSKKNASEQELRDILKEAGGDPKKATEIATKRGLNF